jgi:hypothetical protein
MHSFPNSTIKHDKHRSPPNTRTPQHSLHELITSHLRKLLISHFEENCKSKSRRPLIYSTREEERLMIVFPAQPYNVRRGVFYISDRYVASILDHISLLICLSSRPSFHNSRSRTIVMINIPLTAQHTNFCIERNAMMARSSWAMARSLALRLQNCHRKASGRS